MKKLLLVLVFSMMCLNLLSATKEDQTIQITQKTKLSGKEKAKIAAATLASAWFGVAAITGLSSPSAKPQDELYNSLYFPANFSSIPFNYVISSVCSNFGHKYGKTLSHIGTSASAVLSFILAKYAYNKLTQPKKETKIEVTQSQAS